MKTLATTFATIFGTTHELAIFSPGRVNLIGEHTDYNGGHVFPCALSFGTYALVKPRSDQQYRFYSMNFEAIGTITGTLTALENTPADDWANYPKGVIDVFQQQFGTFAHGFDVLFYGNIPNGAGLSSSASVELAMAVVLQQLFNLEIDMVEMVKLSQKAENEFIGVNCGIMDQFAIGMGRENHAILLDCNTLAYRYSPLDLNGYQIVIANTNKRRGLADSKYNERRNETIQALTTLQTVSEISSLGELSIAKFDELAHLIEDEVVRKRAKHAVYENQRTLKAVEALENADLIEFGQLMIASHNSLRDDYEVTGIELDTLVEVSLQQAGVIGSRMTGAGFGGCTVSIVKADAIADFKANVAQAYTAKIGYAPTFYVADVANGTHVLATQPLIFTK
ncbi:MAG: galactokinase [Culicoidibacterales bacterium]